MISVFFSFDRVDVDYSGSICSRQVLTWKLHWGFCFSLRRLFWQGHPTPCWEKKTTIIYNLSPVSFDKLHSPRNYLLIKSKLTWKLTGGGGFFGSILTTLDSTFGGGRKLFFPTWTRGKHHHRDQEKTLTWCCHVNRANTRKCTLTFMRWSTRASSCVLMDSLQYSLSPGLATSRMANSLWNINTAHLNKSETKKEVLNAQCSNLIWTAVQPQASFDVIYGT